MGFYSDRHDPQQRSEIDQRSFKLTSFVALPRRRLVRAAGPRRGLRRLLRRVPLLGLALVALVAGQRPDSAPQRGPLDTQPVAQALTRRPEPLSLWQRLASKQEPRAVGLGLSSVTTRGEPGLPQVQRPAQDAADAGARDEHGGVPSGAAIPSREDQQPAVPPYERDAAMAAEATEQQAERSALTEPTGNVLQEATEQEAERSAPTEPTGYVIEDRTNMRTGPAVSFKVLGLLDANAPVRLLTRHENWFQIEAIDGTQAWMAAEVLRVDPQVAAVVPQANEVPERPTWVWPANGWLTSRFGWRSQPFPSFHDGIDMANGAGAPIFAARDGVVTIAGWCSGFGYCVKLQHAEGFESVYGHLLEQPNVKVGDHVLAGQHIGAMGSTYDLAGGGFSTGVHLHFTLRKHGQPVDPLEYLR